MSIFLRRIGTSSAFSRNATGKRAAAKGVETSRERGELKEAAAKAVVTKRKSGVLKKEAAKAVATRKREGRSH